MFENYELPPPTPPPPPHVMINIILHHIVDRLSLVVNPSLKKTDTTGAIRCYKDYQAYHQTGTKVE